MIFEQINHSEMYAIFFFILLRFISNANARDSDFVRDYFIHKAVRNVVRFSCGDVTSMSDVSVKISEIKILNYNLRETLKFIDIFYEIFLSVSLLYFLFIVGDFYFVKSLSRAGIFTIVRKYDTNINMRRFLNTETWGLGIVVDLRCNNESAVTIFAEVKKFE